jgi:predicted dehydrogenase
MKSDASVHVPSVMILGGGDRGRTYADWIRRHPDRLRLVALAEPDEARRAALAAEHRIPAKRQFADWSQALRSDVAADGVVVALQDRLHRDAATAALARGAHVLLEKPMATTREDTLAIAREADAARSRARSRGGSLTLCHVLRYSSLFRAVKEAVSDGALGAVQSIFHAENVSYYHFAHSFVRGNWGNSSASSPLILAKSCHDLDILCWLADSPPAWVSSAAGRDFFSATNAPEGAPVRCTDGCPVADSCLYESTSTYLRGVPLKQALARGSGSLALLARFALRVPRLAARTPGLARHAVWREWPTSTITSDLTESGIRRALESGPYGRCVFRCDNDQPDHQDTVIRFENGITASFRLHGRSHEEGRTLRIDGSRATLRARFGSGTVLTIHPHGAIRPEVVPVSGDSLGHSDADDGLMDAWSRIFTGDHPPTHGRASLASHLLAFAADESARTGRAVTLGQSPSTGR